MSLSTLLVLVLLHIPLIIWVNAAPRSFVNRMRWVGATVAAAGVLVFVYVTDRFSMPSTAVNSAESFAYLFQAVIWHVLALSMVAVGLGSHILFTAIRGNRDVGIVSGPTADSSTAMKTGSPPALGIVVLVIVLFGIGLNFLGMIVHAVQTTTG